jgi:ssDNA-binding Zn-finger/Zn-ribbon topoisomerase 1
MSDDPSQDEDLKIPLEEYLEEVGYCPKCGSPLENYNSHEGGWCPKCEEWWPPDIVEDWMEENE